MAKSDKNEVFSPLSDDNGVDPSQMPRAINAVYSVDMTVQVVIGRSVMPMSNLLSMTRGSVIELDKKIGQPVDVLINDKTIARGELVKVGENTMGVKLTEIIRKYSTKDEL